MAKVILKKPIAFVDNRGRVVAPEPGEEVNVHVPKETLEAWEKKGVLSFAKAKARAPKNKAKGAAPGKK